MNSDNLKTRIHQLQNELKNLNKQIKFARKNNKEAHTDKSISELVNEREQMVRELENVTKKLKKVKQSEEQALNIQQKIDSMEFSAAKQTRNDKAMTKARQGKIKREELRKKYEMYTEYENKYNKIDPLDYPGYIFLHEKIIQMYGICPYVYVKPEDFEKLDITEQLSNMRKDWLKQQSDLGNTYLELKNIIIDKCKWVILEKSIKMLEARIDEMFNEQLACSERHTKMYADCVMFFEQFNSIKVKSKKVREHYNKIINLLSQLCSETSIPFNVYLGSKYKINILINSLEEYNDNNKNLLKSESIQNKVNVLLKYDTILNEYIAKLNEFEQHKKFVNNTNTNLQNELYNYISKITENNFTEKQYEQKKAPSQQSGKYFRRWAVLSNDERNERFRSFAVYFVEQLETQVEKCSLVDNLYNMLKKNYEDKNMVYRDFVWNTTKGIIERVKKLTFDAQSNTFNIDFSKKGNSHKNGVTTVRSLKKKTEMEQRINDELLYFLVKTKGFGTIDSFISNIEKRLNVTKNDKKLIEKHYAAFKEVVDQIVQEQSTQD